MKKASAQTSRAKACFHGTTLICIWKCHIHLSNPVSGIRRSVSVADCSEVAVFRTGQGLAANVLSLKNGGWKTRFLIAFSVLRIYYDTFLRKCQLKSQYAELKIENGEWKMNVIWNWRPFISNRLYR